MSRRRVHRSDLNQARIVAELRGLPGVAVFIIAQPVDCLVWTNLGRTPGLHLVDIKNPDNRHKEKRTPDQIAFCDEWPGPVHFCESTEAVLTAIGYQD